MKRPDHAVSIERTVAFHECDPLGIVWHGRYYEFFDVARTALFASVDLDVPEIRALGHRMVVTETRCRYMVPLEYGQRFRVTAWFSVATPLIRVAYDVYDLPGDDASGRWRARAATVLATTDELGRLIPRTPDAILRRLPVA